MTKRKLLCQNSDVDENKDSKLLSHQDGPYETVILEQTIVKIGALLAQGFGEAGTKIIADNMAKTQGNVDPMIPGNKVVAIFGFCDIGSFTKLTNVLQERIIVFVNEIADIVHGTVDKFSGAANKNIGNSFLLVWKFEEEDTVFDASRGNQVPIQDSVRVRQLADMSVISFLKILAQIKKSYYLDKFMRRKEMIRKLKANKVNMGFGLHTGWAIEGAIGSDFKIDASYLSPNVNLASRMQAATVQYGLPILISGELFKILTKKTQSLMR
jgi:class 3 adenylate cyclase